MEKEEIQTARTPEIDRTTAPVNGTDRQAADERVILALQHSAGNRAVGALLADPARAGRAGGAAPFELPLQREPDGPPPEERVWPVAWPEETEGERNEPCFDPEVQAKIGLGAAWADSAAADLAAMPPDLAAAVPTIGAALESWGATVGAEPGKAALAEAMATIGRALDRVSVHVEPVSIVLEQAAVAVVTASGDASAAKSMLTRPASEEDAPRPCFEEGQQAVIAEAVNLADAGATELGRRPPDYRKALATLRNASGRLSALGGEEPGQAKLRGAVADLDRVIASVDAYLTPVETVVAEAAADVRAASAQARQAAEMAVRPRPGGEGAGAPEAAAAPGPVAGEEP